MRKRLLCYALIVMALIIVISQAGCSISVYEDNIDEPEVRSNTANSQNTSSNNKPQTNEGDYNNLVINDFPVSEDKYILESVGRYMYILLDSEIITSTLKLPYSTDVYPKLSTENGQITMSWINQDKVILKVDMVEGSNEAYVNDSNEPLDIKVAPKTVNGKLFIPINLFVSALKMKETTDKNLDVTFLHYEESFPNDLIFGSWSDKDTDIFTAFEDISTGTKTLSSFAIGYQFNKDGTYSLLLISVGGFKDKAIKCSGKYKILGNTLIYYDTNETLYEGKPFKLTHKNKKLDKPSYEFISNYDPDKNRIEISGFWLNKVNP